MEAKNIPLDEAELRILSKIPKQVVLEHRPPVKPGESCLVNLRDFNNGEVLLSGTLHEAADYLNLNKFRYVVGTNGNWMRDGI